MPKRDHYDGDVIGSRGKPSDVGTLFEVPARDTTTAHERLRDPRESAIAAEKATRGLTAKRRAVIEAHCFRGGMTDDELVRYYFQRWVELRWPSQTPSGIRTRRSELRDDGYIEKIGEGTSDAGGVAAVWGLSEKGREWRARTVAVVSPGA